LESVGSVEHRAVAREAVRRSVVVLKNEGLLPISPQVRRVFVAGKNAHDLGNQCGGWTIEWQGAGGRITEGTTILEGIRERVPEADVTHEAFGEGIDGSYDVGIVVLGESPYAEFRGDRQNGLRLDEEDVNALDRVARAGVPTVVVLVSGRPLVLTESLPKMNALVAAWLPGSEGAGVADVLFGRHPETGRLPVAWPRSEDHLRHDPDGPGSEPLFPCGHGFRW
jgi:beta-glucosidase